MERNHSIAFRKEIHNSFEPQPQLHIFSDGLKYCRTGRVWGFLTVGGVMCKDTFCECRFAESEEFVPQMKRDISKKLDDVDIVKGFYYEN